MTTLKRDKLAEEYVDSEICYGGLEYPLEGNTYKECVQSFKAGWDAAIKDVTENSGKDNITLKDVMTQAEALAEALELVKQITNSPEFYAAFHISQLHGMPYRGGQYGDKVSAALDAFQKFKDGL